MPRITAPGYSVDISDAARVALRRVRGLGGVTPIDFTSKKANGYNMTLWYQLRSTALVRALQLHREREGPYFHQFIVFELHDSGGLFRIDRRLRPDEGAPLNSLRDEGIAAFDTIEPVGSWDDPLFTASDCLISIGFKVDVHLALILKICRAIQEHPLAQAYTLQRYNCYFFAQTIILCVACGVSNWAGTGDWLFEYELDISQEERRVLKSKPNSNRGFLGLNARVQECVDHLEGHKFTLATAQKTFLRKIQFEEIRELWMDTSSWGMYSIDFLLNKIDSSIQYLLETHLEAERALRLFTAYNYPMIRDIWDIPIRGFFPSFSPKFDDIFIEIRSAELERVSDPASVRGIHPTTYWGSRPLAICITEEPQKMLGLDSVAVQLSPHEQFTELSTAPILSPEEIDTKFTDTCLYSFKQNMTIRINYGTTDVPQEGTSNSNPEDIPQYRRAQNTVLPWQKPKQEQGPVMTTVTILQMQEYLIDLIRAHSVRVEQYKWATRAVADEVARDIKSAMDDIWKRLLQI
ncbi:hypothetical protein RSOLAG22IIIB_09624 [Rhizoctonia solani]|uniref:Uncharacterized protein n=1 Tax=Rhizoctonia solani TaxID=456999 RepID=A0A0K6FYZ8_9AGAM|nr:hypothetical protein RSOLAG22IIIB_09624 [Rhizoctonia solani]